MILKVWLINLVLTSVLFLIGVSKNKFSIIDIFWGPLHLLSCLTYLLLAPELVEKQIIYFVLVTIWSLRLGSFIFLRSKGQAEDPRSALYREEWGKNANIHAYFKIFLFQASLAFLMVLPSFLVDEEMKFWNWVGMALALCSILGESIADYQKTIHRKLRKSRDEVCERGLWKYMRYPSYFFEMTFWWALTLTLVHPNEWHSLYAPFIISFLLLKVTGVPQVEKLQVRNQKYQEYKSRVKAFWLV